MPLDNFYNRIVALQEFNVLEETMDIIQQRADFMEVLLKFSQLAMGKKGDGTPITLNGKRGYALSTIAHKKSLDHPIARKTDVVTLYLTGDFYSSLTLKVSETKFEFESNVPYFSDILSMAGGENVIHLSRESMDKFKEEVLKPELQFRFKRRINGI